MKKLKLTALVVALCTAASTVSYGAVFSDITSNIKWAESYINSAYTSGLMVGDFNSRGSRVFRGTENMTYSEAAQLIYSIVTKSNFTDDISQMSVERYAMEMDNEGIDDWAKKAVAFGREKGIITAYDITKFKKSGEDVKITREDMAVFFGRALALSYPLATGSSLSFSDTYQISAAAKPYVEILNKHGIFSGDNNNKFNPQVNIIRAEVAVVATKTFDLMKKQVITNPESGYSSAAGTVVSNLESNGTWVLRLATADGTAGFVLNEATPVYNNSSSLVGAAGIGLGDIVTVYYSGASVAKVIITRDAVVDADNVNIPQYTSTFKNKGELATAGEYKISIIDKHGDKTYYVVAVDADITLNGKKATLRQLSDRIKGGAVVEVTVQIDSATQEAVVVEAVEEKYTSSTEGKITNINSREISIKSGTKSYKYDFPKDLSDVSVKFNKSTSSVSSLIDEYDELTGSQYIDVELTLNKDKEVEKIVATASTYKENDEKEVSGELKDITSSEIKIGSKYYDLPSSTSSIDVDIKLGNETIDSFSDLEDLVDGGDAVIDVEVLIEDGEVSEIEGYVSEVKGDIEYMTVSNARYPRGKMGIGVDGYGQVEISFDEDTRIDIGGTDSESENINSLKTEVNKNDINNVEVQFDDDGIATRISD